MNIIKFGGSSVGSVGNLLLVKQLLQQQSEPFVVVVSAFWDVTNQLQSLGQNALDNRHLPIIEQLKNRHFEMAKGLLHINKQTAALVHIQQTMLFLENMCNSICSLGELSGRTQAKLLAQGELLSSLIIYEYLKQEGINISYLASNQYICTSKGDSLNAQVDYKKTAVQCQSINPSNNYIAPGFIASDSDGELVVLGRGGSDYTASIYGYCLNANQVELWSDVNGMQNANPHLVKKTSVIHEMSYEEAFEMSYFGAKVIYPPAIRPAMEKNIPVLLKNTLFPNDKGTRIHHICEGRTDKVLGVSTLSDINMITVSGIGLAGTKGSARRVFQALENAGVNVILITQSCSEQSICFAVKSTDANPSKQALEEEFEKEIERKHINPIDLTGQHVILALIGDNMKHQTGLSGKVFSALGRNGINVQAIAQGASERNISVVIDAKDERKAINVVHERFFQEVTKKIHLFVIGTGNVGRQFLDIVYRQQEFCKSQHKAELRVVAVADSQRFLFDADGLPEEVTAMLKDNGKPYGTPQALAEFIIQANLRNSIVVDNTASEEIATLYADFFKNSISVATCNKIAGSSSLTNYTYLMQLQKDKNCDYQYETSVGAALPIIKTIQNLRLSGDHISRIDAVVSGSLNFIFNHYDGSEEFVEVVRQAQTEGYTEPDPRIDLSGLDVIRKLLILSREAGYKHEIEAVKFNSFLPDMALKVASVDAFYGVLREHETFFKNMYENAKNKNAKLKVVAQLADNQLNVSLQAITSESPFFHLDGKDNIVALYTGMYNPEPLVIKGAGAGAKVTASGVFSDVMYIVNKRR
ncbi:MAG: bifunctional aspartate kinase/homoserine dehydrogenase I [Capnocytophaga sp.]|nr:bifunctional aspartate kinase/homoserine dehydrogenase I [Capnocytophaga sp.]